MKISLLVTIFVFFFLGQNNAQNLKQKTKTENNVKEVFFYKKVKGRGKVKEGEYKKYFIHKHKPIILVQSGQYLNDQKVGVWTYYNFSGDTVFTINLDDDSVIFTNSSGKRLVSSYTRSFGKFGENAHQVFPRATNYIYEVDFSKSLPENTSMPIYVGGDIEFYNILFNSVLEAIDYYSSQYFHPTNYYNNFSGLIVLKINSDGYIESIDFPFTSEPKLMKIRESLMKEKLKWVPAQTDNTNIDFELSIPIQCSTVDDDERYNFEIKFVDKKWIKDLVPYYNPWPFNLSPNSKIFERGY